jgi:glycosyltransferase involved in cell wall biosynthesis
MEPLGESQVLKYLLKISSTHNIHLISFEKSADIKNAQKFKDFKEICSAHQIKWKPLTYSRFIKYLSSIKNIFNLFFKAWIILLRKKIDIVHIRSYMPGIAALPLKKIFKFSLVFDMRGLWADEKVDRLGWKKTQLKYKFFKFLETKLLHHSQSIISLTNGLKTYLIDQGYDERKIITIRTCVDLEIFHPINYKNNKDSSINLGYLGSADTAYDIFPVLELFNQILRIHQNIKLKIFTKSDPQVIYKLASEVGINSSFIDIQFCDRKDLNVAINKLNAILFYLKPSFSLLASMPTKIGESLGCNVPIICNAFNEDIEELMDNNHAGQLIEFNRSNREALRVLDFIESFANKSTCRRLAKNEFNLEVGAQKISDIYLRI